jgi:hypothetical protein
MKESRLFRKIYISHPLRGGMDRANPDISGIVRNKEKIDAICRSIARDFPNVLPLSPVNAFSFFNSFEEDEQALAMCLRLLELADELWMFGDWESSEGCGMERARAMELGMFIRYEDGRKETPKRYFCTAQMDTLDSLDEQTLAEITVKAWDIESARKTLGCSGYCETMRGCGGLRVWHLEDAAR